MFLRLSESLNECLPSTVTSTGEQNAAPWHADPSNIDERMVRIRAFHRNRIPTCGVSQDVKFPQSTFNGCYNKVEEIEDHSNSEKEW